MLAPIRSCCLSTRRRPTSRRARSCFRADGILTAEHYWIFDWTAPYERVRLRHKSGYPQGYLTRVGSFRDIVHLWWIDPGAEAASWSKRGDQSIQLGEGPSDDKALA